MNMQPTAPIPTEKFSRLSVEQDGFNYQKGLIDVTNARLVAEHLQVNDNQDDDFYLVTPSDPAMLLTVAVQSLLGILEFDIAVGSHQTLKDIKAGDSVGLIEGRSIYPGIFQGMEFMNGHEFYVVQNISQKTVEKIPKGTGRDWRIQPYSSTGNVTTMRKGKVYGKQLETILDLPAGGLKAFQQSKILIVPENKPEFISQVRSTSIGGDLIESIFPVADYNSPAEWNYIGHYGANNLKQQPSLGVVANTDIAVDIALNDPDVKLIVISSSKKLRRYYGSIERLNYDETPRKVICLLNPVDEEEMKTLTGMGIDGWVWKRGDFEDDNATYESSDSRSPFAYHEKLFGLLQSSESSIVEVALPRDIENIIDDAYNGLFNLSKHAHESPESGILFRWGLSILNGILQLPVTIKEYDEFSAQASGDDKTMSRKFETYKTRMRASYGFLIPSTHLQDAEVFLKQLDNIFDYFSSHSPKEVAIKEQLSTLNTRQSDTTIFSATGSIAAYVNGKYKHTDYVVSNMERLDNLPCRNALLTGWSNRKNAARSFLAPANQLTWILYKREAENLRRVYASHPGSPSTKSDAKLRRQLGYEVADSDSSPAQTPATEVPGIDELLHSFTERFGRPDEHQLSRITGNDVEQGERVNAKKVTLSDDSYVFVDSDYKLDRIDRAAGKLSRCTGSELSEGDELVFAETDRSMFEELLAILQASDEYKVLYDKASLWRTALLDYIERTKTTDTELVAMFRLIGYPKNIQVIRTWLRGQVIGPSGDNYAAIPAIQRITLDDRLTGKADEIIRACKTLHALHVQTGYLLVRNIVNASLDNPDEVNTETRERLEKYAASARLRTVLEVSDYTIPVAVKHIGKLETDEI